MRYDVAQDVCRGELPSSFSLSESRSATSAHGTRQRPPTVHLQARNHLPITYGACLDFAWKLFGDVRVRHSVGLALIAPNVLGHAGAQLNGQLACAVGGNSLALAPCTRLSLGRVRALVTSRAQS